MVVGWMGEGREPEVLSKKGAESSTKIVRADLETMRLDEQGDRVHTFTGTQANYFCFAKLV